MYSSAIQTHSHATINQRRQKGKIDGKDGQALLEKWILPKPHSRSTIKSNLTLHAQTQLLLVTNQKQILTRAETTRDSHTPTPAVQPLLDPGNNKSDLSNIIVITNGQRHAIFVNSCKASKIQIDDVFVYILQTKGRWRIAKLGMSALGILKEDNATIDARQPGKADKIEKLTKEDVNDYGNWIDQEDDAYGVCNE